MKNYYLLLLPILIFILSISIVKAPCCAIDCYPNANCCATSGAFTGQGVVGCIAKIQGELQYFCPGDILSLCGSCVCTSQQDCNWLADNSLCQQNQFCSIEDDGIYAIAGKCQTRCSEGTKLCADMECKAICISSSIPPPVEVSPPPSKQVLPEQPPITQPTQPETIKITEPTCDGNCYNGKADSCSCPECYGLPASCETGLICDKYTELCIGEPPCPEGTTICKDGFCRANCFLNQGPGTTPDTWDNICNGPTPPQEGCTVSACISETTPCDPGLYCKNGKCEKISPECLTCPDCDKGIGDTCTLAECHNCDLSKCYYYEGLLAGKCGSCPAEKCSDYNKDPSACNAQIKGCEKLQASGSSSLGDCFWTGLKCESCSLVKKCQDYGNRDTCISDPCKTQAASKGVCAWKNSQCLPSSKSDPDDSQENCESYDPTQIQNVCDTNSETNCWDEKATDKKATIKCCGDDKALDTWKNSDGSGCVEGVYFKNPNIEIRLCGQECTQAIPCWSSAVAEEYEDTGLTRCCEPNEQWKYSTTNRMQDLLVKESCVRTEWYKITRADTVTYYELYR